ncbi:MAG: glycosyl hydrolase, partial [Phycisphaerae bacterium]|nr:glycosyl hydrolase [Phycisphaerae bacterium]
CRGLGTTILPKQASSVAAQFGRPLVLSEMFACSGYGVDFEELKWIAEWQFALGVNLVCQSMSPYSLRGCRKRDHPPALHYQQPWWPHYYLLNDYFARLLSVLRQGEEVADVLLLHPITSAWSEFSSLSRAPVKLLDKRLNELANFILATHANFHFGDELILERHAKVSRGKLIVGKRSYRLVVIPDSINIRASTARLLKRFRASGGKIVFAGRVPERVDGKLQSRVKELAIKCLVVDLSKPAGRKRLRRMLDPTISITTARGVDVEQVLSLWRSVGKEQVFFLFNTARDRSCSVN